MTDTCIESPSSSRLGRLLSACCGSVAPLAVASSAFAHHPMGARTPTSFAQAVLSGLAHPVIGVDHLVAILGLGLVTAVFSRGWWLAATFVCSTVLGIGLHVRGLGFPAAEIVMPLGTACFGGLLVSRCAAERSWLGAVGAAVMLAAGTAHGYAYGDAIVGAEPSPLGGYLLGLAAIQLTLVAAVRIAAQAQMRRRERHHVVVGVRIAAAVFMTTGASWLVFAAGA